MYSTSLVPITLPYAGDISPLQAWQWQQQEVAVIVDVRTDAERDWVGFVPGALPLCWKLYPGMGINPAFDEGIQRIAAAYPQHKLLFLCRSGVRSVAAASHATALGLAACYNVLEGFEGDLDASQHRSQCGGWRFHGLPWVQK